MKLETFFQKFDIFADAPNAVAKIRELVLELAVRGRLSSGNPSASSDQSTPFPIPAHWRWCTLSEAADCRASAKVSPSAIANAAWVLDLEDIDGTTGQVIQFATFAERHSLSTKAAFEPGDVLYGKLRPYLNKVVIAPKAGFCTTEIIPLRPMKCLSPEFLRLYLRSQTFLRYAAQKNYGMKMPRLGTKDLESAEIPLPPLAEQQRIVAKVDELMALCDRLEAQQQKRETQKAALARASLARFADAPTPANLEMLFYPPPCLRASVRKTKEGSHKGTETLSPSSFLIPPADLRKAILSLAVQGLLVPHDAEFADWETRKLECLTTKIGSGSTPSGGKESYQEAGVPLIRSMNVHFGGFVRHGLAFLNDEQADKLKNVRVKADDVLLNITGASIGRVATAPKDMEGARVNQHVCILRPTAEITPHS
ncbi:MAG: restriction endonuclease subunit S [Candidatus Marinimicrobia bacterium]|nr:restriction endonuclease subunit S [Candidatus Neomarinimicrobiota bacterium]